MSWWKELALDLSITLLFGVVVHYSLAVFDHDEVWAVETSLGWVIDQLGIYHVPDFQQGRYTR